MPYRSIRGRIRYSSHEPERFGEERGREYFSITQQADGTDVLQAHCEIDDAPSVTRDIVQALRHSDSAPLDCSVRLTVGDKFEGTGWFRFTDKLAECETFNQRDGRITQRMELEAPVQWMQCHPIAGDGLLMRLYDLSQGPGKQHFPNMMLSSPDHRGATGPMLFKMGFSLVYVGETEITVEAGTFHARHFQVTDTAADLPEEHPPYNVWVTADDDYILLRAEVGGYMQTHYELAELDYFAAQDGKTEASKPAVETPA
ncbi:hypothetical protein Mag101_09980 [Microbulbifer agarilyticus]|uniref:DUF3108 domain-containing protein n=1 Tax=Microbulbifer agarilyticus TaxID=260552 RepID=A0A1Q2M5I7_9GAMM|nr:hypothetical protein [Microbulbifer agarilyticus]AQQ67936.1 hypothetical protein Mag101_09980 [Microbulbifer agarilyticus]